METIEEYPIAFEGFYSLEKSNKKRVTYFVFL